MRPCFPGICGFINAVTCRQVRALQPFPTAHIDHARIGGRDSQRPHRARWLIIKDRIPGVSKVCGFPNPAVDSSHVKHIWLMRHAGNRHGAPAAKWSNAAPAHLAKQLLIERGAALLRKRALQLAWIPRGSASAQNKGEKQSYPSAKTRALPCLAPRRAIHSTPPRNRRGYSLEGARANLC